MPYGRGRGRGRGRVSKKRSGRQFLEENPEVGARIDDYLSNNTGQNQVGGQSLKRLKGLPAE